MNKNPVRRFPLLTLTCAVVFSFFILLTGMPLAARPDALQDGAERLAREAAALPHERRMTLVWTNHTMLSERRVEQLRAVFAAQMEAAQVRFVQGEAAPALRVSIEQTPSRIVFTASVPGEGSTSVAIEEVARALAGMDEAAAKDVRLEKELLLQQEAKILSAALLASGEGGDKRLAVLTEEALTIYRGGAGNWKAEATKELPGPRQPQRSARGQLLFAEDKPEQVGILTSGRRCEASVADQSQVACAAVAAEWPAGRLMATPSCGTQTWSLKSDGGDFASEDRLLLRTAGAGKGATPVAELSVAGPVISISAGHSAGSATVTLRNLTTGNYEVYRVALACGD